ncbi:MAG TPA: carboxypeptidase-like regulatory domain-containing protein [Anaerolineaceae bacterium]|nr:carboxypeptidase-like regulatory domain-containing protein [Anaerolineaceae bacterium]
MANLAKKVLQKSIVFFMVMVLLTASNEAAFAEFRVNKTISDSPNFSFIIGGFDYSRGGDGGSIQYGAFYSEARSSIAQNLPNSSFVSFSTLTSNSLLGVGILILTSAYHNSKAITPLTAEEQNVLTDYIKNGGCAILLTDNDSFGGSPASSDANQSLINPFDVTTAGFIPGKVTASVLNPLNSLITNGSYGMVSSFSQFYTGYFTNDGIYANRLANNDLGGALDVINADAIQTGSGPVILFSDANAFWDEADSGYYLENENLFMNSVHFCYLRGSIKLYTIGGRVTDSEGKGIPDVVVSASESGRATSDAQGYYTISALPAGSYTIEPNNRNYVFNPLSYTVNLPPDSLELNFVGKFIFRIHLPAIYH